MSRSLMPNYQFGRRVDPLRIDESNLENKTLQQGEEIAVWNDQVPADKAYVWGYGRDNRDAGDANYIFAELLANGSGTGTDGNVIRDAQLVVAVTDSTQEDTLAKTTIGPDAGDLADAKADARTERPIFPEHSPGATEDKHLQLRVRAGSGADGIVLANDSDVHIGYGQVG